MKVTVDLRFYMYVM